MSQNQTEKKADKNVEKSAEKITEPVVEFDNGDKDEENFDHQGNNTVSEDRSSRDS